MRSCYLLHRDLESQQEHWVRQAQLLPGHTRKPRNNDALISLSYFSLISRIFKRHVVQRAYLRCYGKEKITMIACIQLSASIILESLFPGLSLTKLSNNTPLLLSEADRIYSYESLPHIVPGSRV